MTDEEFGNILQTLTPSRLREIVLRIAQTQAPDDRSGVTVDPIIDAITGGRDLGHGSAGWQRYLQLKRALMDTAVLIPGIKYVESDA